MAQQYQCVGLFGFCVESCSEKASGAENLSMSVIAISTSDPINRAM